MHKLQKVSDDERALESPLSWRILFTNFREKKRLREKLTVFGHPQACHVNSPAPGAQRTANSARPTKHGAQAKNTTQLPAELVYVRIDTTKFNKPQLISQEIWSSEQKQGIAPGK